MRISDWSSDVCSSDLNALVLDKWFQTQALASRDATVDQIVELAAHKDFTLANPNRARALYGAFAANQYGFHHISGKGYRLVTDAIIALDKLNPQTRSEEPTSELQSLMHNSTAVLCLQKKNN